MAWSLILLPIFKILHNFLYFLPEKVVIFIKSKHYITNLAAKIFLLPMVERSGRATSWNAILESLGAKTKELEEKDDLNDNASYKSPQNYNKNDFYEN